MKMNKKMKYKQKNFQPKRIYFTLNLIYGDSLRPLVAYNIFSKESFMI